MNSKVLATVATTALLMSFGATANAKSAESVELNPTVVVNQNRVAAKTASTVELTGSAAQKPGKGNKSALNINLTDKNVNPTPTPAPEQPKASGVESEEAAAVHNAINEWRGRLGSTSLVTSQGTVDKANAVLELVVQGKDYDGLAERAVDGNATTVVRGFMGTPSSHEIVMALASDQRMTISQATHMGVSVVQAQGRTAVAVTFGGDLMPNHPETYMIENMNKHIFFTNQTVRKGQTASFLVETSGDMKWALNTTTERVVSARPDLHIAVKTGEFVANGAGVVTLDTNDLAPGEYTLQVWENGPLDTAVASVSRLYVY